VDKNRPILAVVPEWRVQIRATADVVSDISFQLQHSGITALPKLLGLQP
jgi:hypothetical protein